MIEHIQYIVCSFFISFLCGMIIIPSVIRFCNKKGIYDMPNARKVHKHNIPRLGGVCFLPSMLLASLIAMVVMNNTSPNKEVTLSLWSCVFGVCLLVIYATGLIDDLAGLDAKTKFVIQIIAAAAMPASGLYINNLYGFLGIHEIPFWIGSVITVFLIVFINNAMNLIDGIDGLCGSLTIISLLGFLYCFLSEGLFIYSILIAGLIGVILSFLYFNLFGKVEKKQKIFMGDSGSLTIGYILGFLVVKFSMDNPSVMPFGKDRMMLAFTLLIVPCFDVCRVIITRLVHHRGIFSPDKNHMHHKIMRAGFNQTQTLLLILSISLFFIVFNTVLSIYCYFSMIVALDIIAWLCINKIINVLITKKGNKVFYTE